MEFSRDPYDPLVAFDDYYEAIGAPARDLADLAAAVVRRMRARRLPAPPSSVLGASYDPTHDSFAAGGVVYSVIGDDEAPTGLPMFDELHERFVDALPAPKFVRLDTPESYSNFRAVRRAPYIAALEQRLAAFDDALDAHIAMTAQGGERIRLPVRADVEGAIECWQDGPEILCSVRLPGPDGVRVATTATPAADAVEETLGSAIAEDLEPGEIALVVPPMAQMLGASDLVAEICGAAADLIDCDAPFVGVLMPGSDPALAAAMALLQRCQGGDRRACADAAAMARTHRALIKDARRRLERGQQTKARLS